jgi:8-oxo-dGTP diphosphatase
MLELLLLIVAITLLYVLLPVVAIYVILKTILRKRPRTLKVWFYRTAMSIDRFANVNAAELFNDIFIKKGGYKFGHPDETISSVIGKNQRDKTLTRIGRFLRYILNKIEPNHCLDSIDENITNLKK